MGDVTGTARNKIQFFFKKKMLGTEQLNACHKGPETTVSSDICFQKASEEVHRIDNTPDRQTVIDEEEDSSNISKLKYGVFRYADRIDYILMFFGTFGAAGNGVLITLFSLFFGDLVLKMTLFS
jgi:hypothetical protein